MENKSVIIKPDGKLYNKVQKAILKAVEKIKAWWDKNGAKIIAEAKEALLALWGVVSHVFSRIWEIVVQVFGAVKNIVQEVLGYILQFWNQYGARIWETVKNLFTQIWNIVKTCFDIIVDAVLKFLTYVQPIWENIKSLFASLWDTIVQLYETLKPIFELIGGVVLTLLGVVTGVIDGIISALGPLIQAVIDVGKAVLDIVKMVCAVLRGDWAEAWEYMQSFATNIWSGIKNILLILDRKIKPYLGIEKNGAIQYTALGTFYSNEWQVSQDTQWVKCSGVDKLLRLQSKTYVGYPLTANATLYDIAEDILRKGGFTDDEFSISTSLKDISVGMAFMPKTTIWDALQEIANAGPCRVYMDRDDRVIIKAEGESATYNDIEINPSNMFSFVSNITLTEFANSIKVEYYDVLLSDDLVDTAEVSITLGAYESKNISLGYSSEVAYASAVSDNANIRISNFEGGVDACTFTLRNNSGTAQTATIRDVSFASVLLVLYT